jgi:hypothetical protein
MWQAHLSVFIVMLEESGITGRLYSDTNSEELYQKTATMNWNGEANFILL